MRKLGRRMIPAVLTLSLAASVPAYADDFVPGPDQMYDDATMERLRDNVLEYDEIEMLVELYNTTLRSVRETYSDTREDYKDVVKLKDQIYSGSGMLSEQASELSGVASSLEDLVGMGIVGAGNYADALYASEVLAQQAEQMTLSADSLSAVTPEMLRIQMVDSTKAALVSGAQSAMIGYEQLLLQKETLTDSIALLEEVYKSTQTQASVGMATENDVLTAKQNLDSVKANLITIDAGEAKLRQTLCTLLGWEYDGNPEIQAVPAADLSRIDGMNPEVDKEAAIANNFTLRYNKLSCEEYDSGSVEQQNMSRTIDEQTATISSEMVNLYNDVLQKRNEYQTAVAAFDLEETRMQAADRKWEVGTIGRLEYLQRRNAYVTAQVNVKNSELALFQAMETYDWAIAGNLSIS